MPMHDLLEQLVDEMVDKGVHFDDAAREFEKRFIARVLGKLRRQPDQGRRRAGHAPQHPDPQDGRLQDQGRALSSSAGIAALTLPTSPAI